MKAASRANLIATAAYSIAFISLGMATAVIGPSLPSIAAQTTSTIAQVSLLFTARSLGYLIGSMQAGRLYDRFPGHPLLAGSLALLGLSMALIPLSPLLWVVGLVAGMLGLMEATVDLGGNTLLLWTHKDRVAPFMNALHFFFGVGAILSPLIVERSLRITGGVTWAFWTLALLTLPAVALVLLLPGPDQVESNQQVQSREKPDRILVGLLSAFYFLYVGAEVSFGGWIYTYALERLPEILPLMELELVVSRAAFLASLFWAVFTLSRFVFIPLTAFFSPRSTLAGALFGGLASLALVLLLPNSPFAIWIGTAGLGFSLGPVFPTALSFAQRHIPLSGQTTSWFFAASALGAMTLPWLIGQLIGPLGPGAVMLVIEGDLLGTLLVFFVMMSRSGARASVYAESS